jgi:hypothetical protein
MFDIHAMKSNAISHNVFPQRILSLAILVALTILAGGLVRQSAAQEPAPRAKSEPAPRVKSEKPPSVDKLEKLSDKSDKLSLFDKLDLSSLDKLDLSSLDNLKVDLSSLELEKLSTLDKMDFSVFDNLGRLGQGKGTGMGSGFGRSQAEDDPCEFKIVVLQELFRMDVQRGIAAATDWLKPGSTQTVRCKGAALTLLARNGGKAATPVILGVARNETDLNLRAKAISVLGSSDDDSVIDTLRDFALNSPQTEITEAALYALSRHTSERAIGVLGEIAMSNRPLPLRRAAISSIANRQGEPSMFYSRYTTPIKVLRFASLSSPPSLVVRASARERNCWKSLRARKISNCASTRLVPLLDAAATRRLMSFSVSMIPRRMKS